MCGAEVYARDRCQPCYRYLRKHGRDRPEELVVAYGRRLLDQELESEWVRAIYRQAADRNS